MPVRYEWDVETVEVDGEDIIDHNHANRLSEFKLRMLDPSLWSLSYKLPTFLRLVLVRDVFNEVEGLSDRQWAYVRDDGTLPDHMDWGGGEEGASIPVRFRTELAKWLERGAA